MIGCGTVSDVYLQNLVASPAVEVAACSDLVIERAQAKGAQFGVSHVYSQAELLADPTIDLVVNLTVPSTHFDVTMAALRAGKHVWTEKPLGVDRAQGAAVLHEAAQRGLQVGCAPDTVLGAGLQTCRKLVDEGLIGEPVGATAFFMTPGPERWHPDPVFLYQPGAGPMLDTGIYYVTALVNLLGPVRCVTAFGRRLYPERVIGSGPHAGETFSVGVDTYVTCILQFASGVLATLITTFGISGGGLPRMQIYGSGGVLNAPDPNAFGGPIRVKLDADGAGWRDVPLAYGHTDGCENCRGLGVIEMAQALAKGRSPRASAVIAYHVLDVILSISESAAAKRHVAVASTCERPTPLPAGTTMAPREP